MYEFAATVSRVGYLYATQKKLLEATQEYEIAANEFQKIGLLDDAKRCREIIRRLEAVEETGHRQSVLDTLKGVVASLRALTCSSPH
jgi:hypothetical protein